MVVEFQVFIDSPKKSCQLPENYIFFVRCILKIEIDQLKVKTDARCV